MKPIFFSLSLVFAATVAQAQSANFKTVTDGYANFGAGNIAAILATLSPDVKWTHDGDPDILPFAGTFNGPAEVGRFFEQVGKTTQVSVFLPSDFEEKGNTIRNKVHLEGIVVATGKKYADDFHITWTFGADGKVVNWRAEGAMAGITAASK